MLKIADKDLELLTEVEWLLHEKLVKTNGIKEIFEGQESYYFDENDEDYKVWNRYWNLVEKLCQQKDLLRKIDKLVGEEEDNSANL